MKAKKSYKKGGKFPDLNKDGKITKADVLMGRGVGRKGKKVVAQGADKADVRSENKQNRLVTRAAKKAKRVGDRNFRRDVKSGKLKKA